MREGLILWEVGKEEEGVQEEVQGRQGGGLALPWEVECDRIGWRVYAKGTE